MSLIGAFTGGFASFFSIWIFCLMQVVPFFVALMVASALLENSANSIKKPLVVGGLALFGFMLVFVATGMSGTAISKAVFVYSGTLNQIGGVVIGLVGLFVLGLLTVRESSFPAFEVVKVVSVFLFGSALGMAYKPCVTPTLTKIYNINAALGNVALGAELLLFYALGVSVAILLVGLLLSWLAMNIKSEAARAGVRKVLGAIILIIAGLILMDKMTLYKSFLVERFVTVPMEGHDHSGMDNSQDKQNSGERDHSGMDHSQDKQDAGEHDHMEKQEK